MYLGTVSYFIAVPGAIYTRAVCGYDFIEYCKHNVEKKEIFYRPQKKNSVSFLPTPFFFCFVFCCCFFFFFLFVCFFFLDEKKEEKKKKFCLPTDPTFFRALAETRVFF